MFFLFIFIPFFSFIVIWIFDFYMGKRIALLVVGHFYMFLIVVGFYMYWSICLLRDTQYTTVGCWIQSGLFLVNWGFIFDQISVPMLWMVSIISGGVHLYSIGYMLRDPSVIRFISYLSLFTFFMFILVTADNFIQLFLGWEGIGLCSYLLISFWNTRVQASKASLKALIINRVGDFGFIVGVALIFYFFRSVDFSIIFILTPYFSEYTYSFYNYNLNCINSICFFLFIGSMGKSAQIGLHTWLPDAMEGPTPVSALIHAATLVTAGVFLIIRASPLFEFGSNILFFISIIGGFTSFISATIAIAQYDIKKTIAYSTCSQLGYMIFVIGVSSYHASMFHLINHAFFKALLFLSAGSVIHSLSNDQDIRKYGLLLKLIPFTYSSMLIGFIALAGLPYLAGFYSKDFILELVFSNYSIQGFFLYWLGTLSAGLTAFYSFRIVFNTFLGLNNSYKAYMQSIHELPRNMALTLSVLIVGSIFSGYILKQSFIGFGSNFWGSSIFIQSKSFQTFDFEFIPLFFKLLPLILSIFGASLALLLNTIFFSIKSKFLINVLYNNTNFLSSRKGMYFFFYFFWFLNNKWYFDYIYNFYIGSFFLHYGYEVCYKLIDKGFIELYSSKSLSKSAYNISSMISKKQSGFIYNLACLLILSIFLLFLIIFII